MYSFNGLFLKGRGGRGEGGANKAILKSGQICSFGRLFPHHMSIKSTILFISIYPNIFQKYP